jgi:hypothetical protein
MRALAIGQVPSTSIGISLMHAFIFNQDVILYVI